MPTRPAFTSVFQVLENSSQFCWSIGFIGSRAPALRMSTSGIPSRTTAFISVASVASPAITAAPACSAAARFARSRLIAVTFAPQATSASTIASPSPWLPPVMTTRFPFRFCMLILLYRVCTVVHEPQHPFGAYIASREAQVCGGDERPEGPVPLELAAEHANRRLQLVDDEGSFYNIRSQARLGHRPPIPSCAQ